MSTEFHAALAALAWQVDLGADEAIGRSAGEPLRGRCARGSAAAAPPRRAARARGDRRWRPGRRRCGAGGAGRGGTGGGRWTRCAAALAAFDHCELKRGAKSLVFADGNPAARVLVLGEAPGRDEDIEGRPFVGRAGQLAGPDVRGHRPVRATSPDPATALYITNVMPWRPPQNRDPYAGGDRDDAALRGAAYRAGRPRR